MRVTGLDILVSTVTLLAIAVMIPMPWLLSAAQEASSQPFGGLYCPPITALSKPPPQSEPAAITALCLVSISVKPAQDCPSPAPGMTPWSGGQYHHNTHPQHINRHGIG